MALSLSIACCLISGYLLAALGFSKRTQNPYDLPLHASLAVGYGLGLFSVAFFLGRLLGFVHVIAADLLLLAVLVTAFLLSRRRSAAAVLQPEKFEKGEASPLPRWLRGALVLSYLFALLTALRTAIVRCVAHPHGEGWDAFAIWNLHARFLFRGGDHWRDGFSPLIPWSHPDYPLLLPSAVAHFWTILGHESTAVPALIGLAFTFGTVGVLHSALASLRGRTVAMLGGLALVCTPSFVEQGSSQYADVPLSFFFLAAITMINLGEMYSTEQGPTACRGPFLLAGLAAGFALWTKNEGTLFLCALLVAHAIETIRSRRVQLNKSSDPGNLLAFGAPVAAFVLFVTWLKHSIAFPNELFTNHQTMFQKVLDPRRYWAISQWFVKDFLRFGEWWLIPGTLLLVAVYFVAADRNSRRSRPAIRTSVLTLALTLAGYFAIYVITPYDLYWHLRFSLNRLFLQLWPSAVFLFFLAFPFQNSQKVSE